MTPLLLGHRGARAHKSIPENTLASFDLALAQGCDGFEFDVRLTADEQAVICHDATSGHLKIAESLAQSLNLPTLREVLTRYQGKAFLDVELKVAGLEQITADLLCELAPSRGVVVSSFLPEVLQTLHALEVNFALGLICGTREELHRWPGLPIQYVIPHHKLLRRDVLPQMKAACKKVLVWTVNVPADMKRLAKAGVDGIISDNPKLLALTLRGKPEAKKK
jgi:glycerophosphoryl diester phosphodiesterase